MLNRVKQRKKVCRICNISAKLPWIGCDQQLGKELYCEYWADAASIMGFTDAKDNTFVALEWYFLHTLPTVRCHPPSSKEGMRGNTHSKLPSSGLLKYN